MSLKKLKHLMEKREIGEVSDHVRQKIRTLKLPLIIILVLGLVWFLLPLAPNIFPKSKKEAQTPQILQQSPENPNQLKLQKTANNPCNTTNNFEDSIWEKKESFRIISENPDTKEPEYLGAKTTFPYQSQMIYPFDCSLPLISTVSAIIGSPKSAGLQVEFEGVFQTILGDGDLRAIRYKKDTQGTRKEGWSYIRSEDGKKITHWLPNNITPKTQIDLTSKIEIENQKLKITTNVDYKPEGEKEYTSKKFDSIYFEVESFNINKNPGKRLRTGINDEKFEGKQAKIKFLKFQLSSRLE